VDALAVGAGVDAHAVADKVAATSAASFMARRYREGRELAPRSGHFETAVAVLARIEDRVTVMVEGASGARRDADATANVRRLPLRQRLDRRAAQAELVLLHGTSRQQSVL